jgi:[ribosomal protein S5]-alanine N-acetyltransferase
MDGTKFKMRSWEWSDIDSLVKYANNWNVARHLNDRFPFPFTENHARAFIEIAIKESTTNRFFSLATKEESIGGVAIQIHSDIYRKNAEIGYWLAEPFWGQGIISNAIKQTVDLAFYNYTIDRVFARTFGTNIGSQKVLTKNNFILEAKFEQVIIKNNEIFDELFYGIRRKDWNINYNS